MFISLVNIAHEMVNENTGLSTILEYFILFWFNAEHKKAVHNILSSSISSKIFSNSCQKICLLHVRKVPEIFLAFLSWQFTNYPCIFVNRFSVF